MRKFFPATMFFWTCIIAIGMADAAELSDLMGKSIASTYFEEVTAPNGMSWQNNWRDDIYVSSQGRIFHKVRISGNGPAQANKELVSGEGGGTFRFEGSGFVREFTNPRTGIHVRESISINGTTPGSPCSVQIFRSSARAQFTPLRQSCRVVAGNIVGH